MYFVEGSEPEDFKFNFEHEVQRMKQSEGCLVIDMDEDIDSYYDKLEKIDALSNQVHFKEIRNSILDDSEDEE